MGKIIKFILIFLAIFIVIVFVFSIASKKVSNINGRNQMANLLEVIDPSTPLVNSQEDTEKENETTLFFVGDMMLTRSVKKSVMNNFGSDYNKLFENLTELKDADILFANLEGDVSDKGNNVGSKWSFRMDVEVLPALKNAGFDIVSFANNHVGDWNMSAFKDTLTRLNANGILKVGAGFNKQETIDPTIIEKNDVKFGFLGFTDVGPVWMKAGDNIAGVLLASDPEFPNIIANAKDKCDILIVSIHWGEEYKKIHNKRQETLAYQAIDNGADMVIGHHPHVMEDIGEYKGKPIVYSLGNFIFDQYFSEDTMKGMIFKATFKGKELKATEHKVITLSKKYQPEGIFTEEEVRNRNEMSSTICPKPTKEYDDLMFMNIGKENGLPDESFIPKDLREINIDGSINKGTCLVKEARDNFETLSAKAKENGYDIKATTAFRSYNFQNTLYTNSLKKNNVSVSDSVAKPGYSEHQLGTAVDITAKSIDYTGTSGGFANTPEAKWVKENASNYGFIESYPYGKDDVTGYMYEPWHYRYVGIDMAAKIIKSGQTVNEYLKTLQ